MKLPKPLTLPPLGSTVLESNLGAGDFSFKGREEKGGGIFVKNVFFNRYIFEFNCINGLQNNPLFSVPDDPTLFKQRMGMGGGPYLLQ